MIWEGVLILLLIAANGLFALTEYAIVSSRRQRLEVRADEGDHGARAALGLVDNIEGFIYAVQVGTTVVGILAGAIGGESITRGLAAWMTGLGLAERVANSVALLLVALAITYFTLVLGELVPKRMALNDPEGISSRMSRPMRAFAWLVRPAVKLVGGSTDLVLRLLGVTPPTEPSITEDEIRALVRQGIEEGVIEAAEQEMVESVFELNDRLASAVMTARPDVVWLDTEASAEELRQQISQNPYSRFPLARGSLDDLIGEVNTKDLLVREWAGEPFDLMAIVRAPLFVPEIMPALNVLEALRYSGTPIAFVIDEYGSMVGVVTLTDILEEIVGDIPSPSNADEAQAVQRDDGSWLVDGLLPIDDFREVLDLAEMPGQEQGIYQTVGGFIVMSLGRMPAVTDSFDWREWRFEVMDMDGPRVDKVLVQRRETTDDPEDEEA